MRSIATIVLLAMAPSLAWASAQDPAWSLKDTSMELLYRARIDGHGVPITCVVRGLMSSDTSISALELGRVSPVFAIVTLLSPRGRAGICGMDAETWLERTSHDTSVTGMLGWLDTAMMRSLKSRESAMLAKVGIVAASSKKSGAWSTALIQAFHKTVSDSVKQHVYELIVRPQSGSSRAAMRKRTVLPEVVIIPGGYDVWVRIDASRLNLNPSIIKSRSAVLSAHMEAAIVSGSLTPAGANEKQFSMDAPGLFPFALTQAIGDYWIDHVVAAVRFGEKGAALWMQLIGKFDGPALAMALKNAPRHAGWRDLDGLLVKVDGASVTVASKSFVRGHPQRRLTNWSGEFARSAELIFRGKARQVQKCVVVVRGRMIEGRVTFAKPADAKVFGDRLAEIRESQVRASNAWVGINEVEKDEVALARLVRRLEVTRDHNAIEFRIDTSSLSTLMWCRAVAHAQRKRWLIR